MHPGGEIEPDRPQNEENTGSGLCNSKCRPRRVVRKMKKT